MVEPNFKHFDRENLRITIKHITVMNEKEFIVKYAVKDIKLNIDIIQNATMEITGQKFKNIDDLHEHIVNKILKNY